MQVQNWLHALLLLRPHQIRSNGQWWSKACTSLVCILSTATLLLHNCQSSSFDQNSAHLEETHILTFNSLSYIPSLSFQMASLYLDYFFSFLISCFPRYSPLPVSFLYNAIGELFSSTAFLRTLFCKRLLARQNYADNKEVRSTYRKKILHQMSLF